MVEATLRVAVLAIMHDQLCTAATYSGPGLVTATLRADRTAVAFAFSTARLTIPRLFDTRHRTELQSSCKTPSDVRMKPNSYAEPSIPTHNIRSRCCCFRVSPHLPRSRVVMLSSPLPGNPNAGGAGFKRLSGKKRVLASLAHYNQLRFQCARESAANDEKKKVAYFRS
jgi:hypothetical protein